MGCDFYTLYKLCIEYKEGDEILQFTHQLRETQQRHYWWEIERDEDFEDWNDYHKRASKQHQHQIEQILCREYPRVDLCVNGLWKCLPSAKQKYLELVKEEEEEEIPEDAIVNVWKEGTYWVR